MTDEPPNKPPKRIRLDEQQLRRFRPDDDKVVYINGKKHRSTGGKPAFVATDDERRLVQSMVANGIPQMHIRTCIRNPYTDRPIDQATFVKAFGRELEISKAQVDAAVGASLVQRCLGRQPKVLFEETTTDGKTAVKKKVLDPGCEPDTTAIIWYEKTRRGFKEGHVVEHCGPDGQPLPAAVQINNHTVIVLPSGRSTQDYIEHQLPKPEK